MDLKNDNLVSELPFCGNSDSDFTDSELEFQLYSQIHYKHESAGATINGTAVLKESEKTTNIETTSELNFREENHLSKFLMPKDIMSQSDDNTTSSSSKDRVMEYTWGEDTSQVSEISDLQQWEILDDEMGSDEANDIKIHITEPPIAVEEEKDPRECWTICKKDIIAGMDKSNGLRTRYFDESNIRCKNCTERGHIAVECEKPKKLKPCFMCGHKGHMAKSCPKYISTSRRHLELTCNRCEQVGHIQAECPDNWRQFHITTKPGSLVTSDLPLSMSKKKSCYNCAKRSHFGFECTKSRRQYFAAVTQPTVYRYDHWLWIERKGEKRPRIQNNTQPRKEKKKKSKTKVEKMQKKMEVTRTVHFNFTKENLTVKRPNELFTQKAINEQTKNFIRNKQKPNKPQKNVKRKAINHHEDNFKQNKKFKHSSKPAKRKKMQY